MLESFLHKGLRELWLNGGSANVPADLTKRCRNRLQFLNAAKTLNDLNLPGFDTHPLKGAKPPRYSISVNGPWRITFEFEAPNAKRIDLEQYH